MKKHILCWVLFSPIFLQAQKWSLQQCVDSAIKNNLTILQAYDNVQNASLILSQSRWTQYPNLNANTSQTFNFGRALDQTTYQFSDRRSRTNNFSLNSSVVLYNGGQIKNVIRQNQLFLYASHFELQQLKDQISLDVVNAFITVLYATESVNNVLLQQQSTKELTRSTELLVQAGKKAESDLAQLKAQAATERYNLAVAQGDLRTSKLNLQQLMEVSYDENFEISIPSLPEADLNLLPGSTQVYNIALQIQPSIKSSELQIEIEKLGLKLSRAGLYPKLSFNAGLNSNYSSLSTLSKISTVSSLETVGYLKDNMNQEVVNYIERNIYTPQSYAFFRQLSDKFNQSVSLSLSIPIINGKQARYAIKKQEVKIHAAELNDRLNKNALRKNIEQASVEAGNAQTKYLASKEALNAEEITYQNLQLLFEASKATAVDLLIEKNKYAVSTSQLLQAKYDLVLKLKVLDYYQGKPLYLR